MGTGCKQSHPVQASCGMQDRSYTELIARVSSQPRGNWSSSYTLYPPEHPNLYVGCEDCAWHLVT